MSAIIASVAGVVAVALLLVAVVPWYTRRRLHGADDKAYEQFTATTELRRVVVETMVAVLLLIGAVTAISEYRATKSRQDSERFAQVIELLGSSDVPTQIGAVYGMEGVARSDAAYYPIVDDTLSAMIRTRVPYGESAPGTAPTGDPADTPVDPVVQAAIRVLGRVPHRSDRRLDLSRSNLRGVDLLGGDFRNASFDDSNLYEVTASGADLRGASFHGAVSGRELCVARLGDNPGLPTGGC
ncbi:pentapeptide repeat-containing protein [Solwaraspora sp. WMMB335]|uniref:pentapeptide repeat-containing protein n=1 Tax=Solwaraspora sp. WMMB335 TaxID=3404118 RepID=UPI003B93A38E